MRLFLLATVALAPVGLLAAEPGKRAPLHRFYNQTSKQHAYSVDPDEKDQWRRGSKAVEHHAIGKVATRPLPGTTRLYRAYRETNQRHFYFTKAGSLHRDVTRSLENFRAYVWTEPGDGRIGIYASTASDGTDVFYDPSMEKVLKYDESVASGRGDERRFAGPNPVFYVYPADGYRPDSPRSETPSRSAASTRAETDPGHSAMLQPARRTFRNSQEASAKGHPVSETLADVIEQCEKSVVRIEVQTDLGEGLGSGFVIGDKIIATNLHVLAGAETAKAFTPSGQDFRIDAVLAVDDRRDVVIATLQGSGASSIPELPFADGPPRKGDSVFALGSPLGLSFSASVGVVSAIRPAAELTRQLGGGEYDGTWVQVDAALSPGNSGGPLINRNGRVVAMSTLASHGAQNLNFGISGVDVQHVLELSRSNRPSPLSESVKGFEHGAQSRSSGSQPQAVTKEALASYIARGYEEYASLRRELAGEISELHSRLREMQAGATSIPPEVRRHNRDSRVIHVSDPRRRGGDRWFFLDEQVKQEAIDAVSDRLQLLAETRRNSGDRDDPEELLTLLRHYGPAVDTRENGSVGFMSHSNVLNPLDDRRVLVVFEDAVYLLAVDSTAGLSIGRAIAPRPVLVSGTATVELPGGGTTSVTVLQTITEATLEEAVEARAGKQASQSSSPAYREWTDRTGRFSVDAQLVGLDGNHVELKRRDGKTIRVPVSKLSDADRARLRQ